MKKAFFILLLIATVNLNSNLKSMEKPTTMEIDQSGTTSSLWPTLPYELQQKVLSLVGFDKATSFEQVLEKLKDLEKIPMFSNLIDTPFITSLAKKYIEKRKDEAYQEFFQAIRHNKISLVRAFADAGIDVNAIVKLPIVVIRGKYRSRPSYQNEPVLSNAVRFDNREIVKILLDARANVNYKGSKSSNTALMIAATTCNKENIQMLIDHGADVNAQNISGRTALMITIDSRGVQCWREENRAKTVKILLDAGAHVNLRDKDGITALAIAEDLSITYPSTNHPEIPREFKKIIDMLKSAGAKE